MNALALIFGAKQGISLITNCIEAFSERNFKRAEIRIHFGKEKVKWIFVLFCFKNGITICLEYFKDQKGKINKSNKKLNNTLRYKIVLRNELNSNILSMNILKVIAEKLITEAT